MYKLLIVDDEPTVRTGLRGYVDWSAHGIEVAGEADDGDTALDLIERETPDLVLTDVRMPSMDGIALSREISSRYPEVKIIFVSGHDDAEYLKSALKVSAVDYIFKPVNLHELGEVVGRVVAGLNARDREREANEERLRKLKESMPLLREKFLLSLVGGAPQADLRERAAFLGLDLPVEAPYWVIALSVDDLAEVTGSRSEQDRQLLWYAVRNVCQELIDRRFRGCVFEHSVGAFVCILLADGPDAEEALFGLAGDIRDNLERWLRLSVTIGIGEQAASLSGLASSYRQAREAAEHKWYLGKNQIITMDSLDGAEGDAEGSGGYGRDEREALLSALKAANPDTLREVLDRMFADLNRGRRDGLRYGRNVCLQIVLAVGQLVLELNAQSAAFEASEAGLIESLLGQETLSGMRALVESYVMAAYERIRDKRSGKTANLVERVQAIIDERYGDGGLTVAEIGKEVYLTPTYVSLLFKQETGRTIGEYLTQVRIGRAKAMLRDPRYKLYDICHAIGFTDPSYFTKLFKKETGVTPSAYRDGHA
ncbi:response regulator transcription factor [Cohnella sp. JJ-181]|uniref:response regulator transcription factor n=1 Tax=Cohnella rhizoplanae TaxID=2974897 RepID=UPI0022FF7249|nr:response regulator [Cohnella sp. JJ-181]CAI6086582.1 Protein-glutamate methylesterase/protein-glutamine glutaminase [Cohnella sp. JJ-181]